MSLNIKFILLSENMFEKKCEYKMAAGKKKYDSTSHFLSGMEITFFFHQSKPHTQVPQSVSHTLEILAHQDARASHHTHCTSIMGGGSKHYILDLKQSVLVCV